MAAGEGVQGGGLGALEEGPHDLGDDVAARGSLAPPTVTADTDSTGPNVWLGVGRRF